MIKFALAGLEKAINTYLGLDPDTVTRLAVLEGKVIKIVLTDLQIHFFILPKKNGIQLVADYSQPPHTTISGTSVGLFKASCAQISNSALFKNAIYIDGDTALGESMRHLLTHIDIDWEEQLSHIVGDAVAHQVGVGFRHTIDMGRYTAKTIRDNVREYLQEESQCTPTRAEVESFLHNVSTLRNDVDRAEARLKRMLAKRNKLL